MSAPDFPTVISGFTDRRHRIYLPSSPDLPTVISRFTYRHHRIYLPSSPDLPTLVSGFTYPRLRIYLPLSRIYLPSCLDYFSKFLKKSNMVITFLFYSKKKFILWSFSDFTMVIIFWCWSFSVLPIFGRTKFGRTQIWSNPNLVRPNLFWPIMT